MGIMLPETCCEIVKNKNKHLTVASCWFSLSLHNIVSVLDRRKDEGIKTVGGTIETEETEVIVETSIQSHSVNHKSHYNWSQIETGPPQRQGV